MPLAQSPTNLFEQPFTKRVDGFTHAQHRANLHAFALAHPSRGQNLINVYSVVCSGYMRECFGYLWANNARIEWPPLLISTFGMYAGRWLYGHLYTRNLLRSDFLQALRNFKDPAAPEAPHADWAPPEPRSSPVERTLPPSVTPVRAQATHAGALAFRRDQQLANRTALAAVLIERDGTVTPRGYVTRWLKASGRAVRYERRGTKFVDLFGAEAAAMLDVTDKVDRRALCVALRALI